MDPVGAFLIAVLIATGIVRRWFGDAADWARGNGTPRHDRLMAQRAQEHEERMQRQQLRHAERIAGVGGPTIGEAVAERIRRGPLHRDEMGPLRGWWHDLCADRAEELTRQRRARQERTANGEQWWQRWADNARRRAERYWEGKQREREERRRRADIPEAEWWDNPPEPPDTDRGRDDADPYGWPDPDPDPDPDPEPGPRPGPRPAPEVPDANPDDPTLCRGCGNPTSDPFGWCFACHPRRAEVPDEPRPPDEPEPARRTGTPDADPPRAQWWTAERTDRHPPRPTPELLAGRTTDQPPPVPAVALEPANTGGVPMPNLPALSGGNVRAHRATVRHSSQAKGMQQRATQLLDQAAGDCSLDTAPYAVQVAEAIATGVADSIKFLETRMREMEVKGVAVTGLASASEMILNAATELWKVQEVLQAQVDNTDDYEARARRLGAGSVRRGWTGSRIR